jgi:hypothetical protein
MASARGRWARSAALALAAALAFGAPSPAQQQDRRPDEKPEDYPDAPHREDTFYFCTACHGFRIVAAQRMSRARWDETLDWMERRHNLPKTEGDDRAHLLDYLSTAFPEATDGQRGFKNPFTR